MHQAPLDSLTFDIFSEVNMDRHVTWPHKEGGSTNWGLSEWGIAAAEEMGEVCGAIKRINRLKTGQILNGGTQRVHTDEDALMLLRREIGDVVTYLDLLAQEAGSSLGECTQLAFNGVSIREGLPHRV